MRKLRVYELARHYGVDSKQIMLLLQKMKVEAKSHMSVVEDDSVDKIHGVFQRKRELARQNYARAHKLDPAKLESIASLRPLPRPQPPDEPEIVEAPKKKTAAKKKKKKVAAKSKVVVITKTGQQTRVAKEAAARKAAELASERAKVEDERRQQERLEAERAQQREEHRQERVLKRPKLVKKTAESDAEALPSTEAAESAAAAPTATGKPVTGVAEPAVAGEVAPGPREPAAAAADRGAGGAAAGEPGTAEAETPATTAPEAADVESATAAAVETGRRRPAIKNDGFKVGDIVRPAPPPAAAKPAAPRTADTAATSSLSVKESIQAAIRRRQDEKAAQEAVGARRKRSRSKKKKVDEAEVERQLKLTMAQMEGVGGRTRRRRKGGLQEAGSEEAALRITEFITVQEFAEKLEVPAREIIAKLFGLGIMVTMNQRLDKEHIELLAEEYERDVEFLSEFGEELLEQQTDEVLAEDLELRPPVVTVMGHVDHGKTSLLDRIRQTNVIAGEAGGITQHIGAYKVETEGGPITFLDTPGHAAFTAMRARGASVTDIVILTVAANDGVMPQTIEALNHAKAAGVPIIVAINKIDLPDAKPDRVKQELTQHGILVEEFGGDVLCTEISAKKGVGIERLLELVHLQAEVLELQASPKGPARGTVIEARKEPGRGVVFSVLIDRGTLHAGDIFVVGLRDGRVRALINERGEKLEACLPGQPAEVLGAHDVPEAGDRFYVMASEREAREIAARRQQELRVQQLTAPRKKLSLESLANLIDAADLKELPIIIKGDMAGSVEALANQFMELGTSEVQVRIIHKAVGAISESDVLLAANTDSLIIGFHLRPGVAIQELAKQYHVEIEVFDIIYEAVDTLRKAMAGLLGSIQREVSTGKAQVRQVFSIPKIGQIAGSMVLEGKITRNSRGRLVRDEMVIFEGKISSLKRFKEDTREVLQGYECGIGLENFQEIKEGDIIETFEIEEVRRTEL
ncbi:MAG: translation initiation factor IF-2 [Candidatus Krumholzibacteria bacterium]|nr:translation initiation factor IF-2 [Candidatus Krumholzibacteria bacterium]